MEFVEVRDEELIRQTAKLAADIWRDHYIPLVGVGQVEYMLDKFQSERAISEQIKSGYLYYLLLEQSRQAGYIALESRMDTCSMFISKYYVSKQFRGRGLGRICMEFIEDRCRDMGLKSLWLTVNKDNIASIAVYEKLGFDNAGSVVADIGGGYVMDDYKMVKNLF